MLPLVAASAVLFSACNGEPGAARDGQLPEALSPAKASVQIEKTFADTKDPKVKEAAKAAATALKNRQYDVAYGTLQQLKGSDKLSPAEDMAVRNAIIGIGETGAKEAAAGDKKVAEMMRKIRGGP